MKMVLLFVALLCAVALSGTSSTSVAGVAKEKQKERAVTKFDQPVSLLGVVLKGEYLFVHDDAAMARGEACTFVYKGVVEAPDKLVVSFHFIPKSRKKVANFTVRTNQVWSEINELREIQFARSTEAHLVPTQQGMRLGEDSDCLRHC
jgi:hypothetical protein